MFFVGKYKIFFDYTRDISLNEWLKKYIYIIIGLTSIKIKIE